MVENYLATPNSSISPFLKFHPGKESLEIGFKTKEFYQYLNAPLKLWKNYCQQVLAGGSSGNFFNENIKDKYEFIKST
jgi:hypothetical protein